MSFFRRPSFRASLAFAALCLVLGSCGSSVDTSSESEPTDDSSVELTTTVVQTTEAPTSDADAAPSNTDKIDDATSDDEALEEDTDENVVDTDGVTEPDDANESTPTSTIAEDHTVPADDSTSEPAIDLTTVIAAFVPPEDLDDAVLCVENEFRTEDVDFEQVLLSNGIIVAIVRCARDVVRDELFSDFADIESSAIAASPEQINCTLETFLDFIAELDMDNADSVFDTAEPPQALVDRVVNTCGVTADDALFLLTEA